MWFDMTLLLVIAVISHFLVARMKQPLIIGEILVGIAIGFIGMSVLHQDVISMDILEPFSELGAVILLFQIGLECDLKQIYTKRNMLIALGGVVVPWVSGFFAFSVMQPSAGVNEAIFVGTILVSTSVAVTASVLQEMKAVSTSVGSAILGAAVIDDILGMIVLAISKGAVNGTFDPISIVYLVCAAAVFVIGGLFLGIRYLDRVIRYCEGKASRYGMGHTGFVLAIAVAFLYAFIAELIGISAIVGAFIAGTVFASIELKNEFKIGTGYLAAVFVPVFFVIAGIMFDVNGLAGILLIAIVITLIAIVTKIIGCGIPAMLMGMKKREAVAVGVGMAPRLEVAMVIAIYGLENGIITESIYSMAIFVGIVTALITPSVLRPVLEWSKVSKGRTNEADLKIG